MIWTWISFKAEQSLLTPKILTIYIKSLDFCPEKWNMPIICSKDLEFIDR
jgi:hypothetical protein